jgi:tetratricopeptide (TPR) repeat protein
VLSGRQPLLLLLDDLQWCDRDTFEWLHFLLRSDPQARLLLVGTIRIEELVSGHPLETWLAALRRRGQVAEIELAPLDSAETTVLAAQVLGRSLEPRQAARMYTETEGNPLFIVETARTETIERHERSRDGTDSIAAPPTVQSVIKGRLDRLSPAARDLARLAATIGRAFTVSLLARASEGNEDTLVRGLDELWQRRIVREQGGDSYDFSHDKIRESAYTELSSARRRLLHRRVAEAIEATHAHNLAAVSGQLAIHYERAGLPARAIPYYQQAAEVARQMYANAEAIDYYRQALALLESASQADSDSEWHGDITARLHEMLGDTLELIGRHDEAMTAYSAALACVLPEFDRLGAARLHRQVATTLLTQHRYDEAIQTLALAETTLGPAPLEPAERWWQEWAWIQTSRLSAQYYLRLVVEMNDLTEQVRPIVERYGTPTLRVRFFESLFQVTISRDRYVISDDALSYSKAALLASKEAGNLNQTAQIRFNTGFSHIWRGELDQAEAQLRAALDVAERTGHSWLQIVSLAYLAVDRRRRGHVEDTLRSSQRALEVASYGENPVYIALSQANLAWVAWCKHDLAEARLRGLSALELWRQLPMRYPLQGLALWPLIAAALVQDQLGEATDYVRCLLEPSQQRLADGLEAALAEAIRLWDQGQLERTRRQLQRAVEMAQAQAYL